MIWKPGCNFCDAVWNWQSKSEIMQKPLSQNVPCLLNFCQMQSTVWGNLHYRLSCRIHPHTPLPDVLGAENNKMSWFQKQGYSRDSNHSCCWTGHPCLGDTLLHIQTLPLAVGLFLWYSHFLPLMAPQGICCPGFLMFSSLINGEIYTSCRADKVTLALLNQPAVFSVQELPSICYHLNKKMSLANAHFFCVSHQ